MDILCHFKHEIKSPTLPYYDSAQLASILSLTISCHQHSVIRLHEDSPALQTNRTIRVMPRRAVQIARMQIVQRVSVIQQMSRRAETEGEVSQGRKAELLGCVAAKESRKDGQAAADDASAHFGSAARGQREGIILKNWAELPEYVD